jgi:hypothetical protein
MAATAAEFPNARDIVYDLRRLFIHRFPVVNAINWRNIAISLIESPAGNDKQPTRQFVSERRPTTTNPSHTAL